MKIADLQVDGFGVWKGLTVDAFSENMTVFYGHNEAGKTTLMQFVRSMLFGFSPERRDRYVPPVYGGLAGGSMAVSSPLGGFEIQRHVDHNRINDPIGDLAVTDAGDGSVHGRAQLGSILSDVDESIFNNVFAIGLREIQELGALNSTAAAEHLYKLTSGLDRVSLVDVMKDLGGRRDSIWSYHPDRKCRIDQLVEKRQELQAEIDELSTRSRRWSKISMQTNEVSRRLDEVEEQIRSFQEESRIVEIAMQVGERWQKRSVIEHQIDDLGALPEKRDLSVKQLDQLNAKIVQNKQRLNEAKTARADTKREALELPINRHLWSQSAKIHALNEHLPWIDSLQRQTDRLQSEIDTIENTIGGEVNGLSRQLNVESDEIEDIAGRGLIGLRTSAKRMVDETEKQAELQSAVEDAESVLSEHTGRLRNAVNDQDGTYPDSIEDAGKTVQRMRRRVELESKLEKLQRTRKDLERELDDVINDQVMPVGKLSIIGFVFILGVVLLGFGLVSMLLGGQAVGSVSQDIAVLCLIGGVVVGLISIFLKYNFDQISRDELKDYQHQFDLVRQQIKKAKSERDEIERQLPRISEQSELDLKDAEFRLASLEDIVPLENRIKNSKRELEARKREMEKQMIEVEAAEARWRESLRSMNLPETMSPMNLQDVIEKTEKINGFKSRLVQYHDELNERNAELNNINRKIDTVLEESGIPISDDAPAERLHHLTGILGQQAQLVARRKELSSRFRNMRSKMAKITREIDRLLGQKQKLLSNVGAETEEEFRNLANRWEEREVLLERRGRLTDQIEAALGKSATEKQVGEQLEAYGHSGLEKRWEWIQAEIEELRGRETKLHQHRGELLKEVEMLGEDSRLDEARLELNAVEMEFEQLKQRWKVLATSSNVLESIRENYESQRQPETLKEASGFLKRLTEGQYDRIWTRLVGEELLVDNHAGETLSVEHLSRGTREAVYLALRLALVGAYSRRGAVLPMVLDDVLVNFDTQRARAAASVLRDFAASGYQILMFTCHDHIRDLFHDLQVQVRILPHHKDVVETNAVPVDYEPQGAKPVIETVVKSEVVLDVPAEPIAPRLDPIPVPVPAGEVTVVPSPSLSLQTEQFDPELEYELSAVARDQRQFEENIESRLESQGFSHEPEVDRRSA